MGNNEAETEPVKPCSAGGAVDITLVYLSGYTQKHTAALAAHFGSVMVHSDYMIHTQGVQLIHL